MLQRLVRFSRDEDGATATEYAVLLALILVVVFTAIKSVGDSTSGIWDNDTNKITTAISGS